MRSNGADATNLGRHWFLSGRGMRSWGSGQLEPAATYRPKALVDLLFLVLESDARTRRAWRLLVPLMLAFVAIFAILATWAILQPAHAGMIVGVFGAAIALPAMAVPRTCGLAWSSTCSRRKAPGQGTANGLGGPSAFRP